MGIVKVIEVLAQSEKSWEDAVQTALKESSRTVRNIRSIYTRDFQAVVENNRIVQYRLCAKISFEVENADQLEDFQDKGRAQKESQEKFMRESAVDQP